MSQKSISNHLVLDNLIRQYWDIRNRLLASPGDRNLEQQWIFIRRVMARSLVQKKSF